VNKAQTGFDRFVSLKKMPIDRKPGGRDNTKKPLPGKDWIGMTTVREIIKAVKSLDPEEFLKLRTALDGIEEKHWDRELGRVTAKHRKEKLTDAKIDALVLKRRHRGRRA
jgi:hypothetical protein